MTKVKVSERVLTCFAFAMRLYVSICIVLALVFAVISMCALVLVSIYAVAVLLAGLAG